jgi:pyruvate dehydrogenase E2 component (dihydrolipoamide acetyltransferase)
MAITVTIPRLGWNMDEGVFIGWLKRDGEAVRAGEPLFTLEGEKAAQDIEATDNGILRIPPDAPPAGARVAVGAPIGYLLRPGEVEPVASGAPAAVRAPESAAMAPNGLPRRPTRRGGIRISPLARRLAQDLGVDWSGLRGSGRTGRIRKVDVLAAARPGDDRTSNATTRRTIAARLVESHRTTAPVTLTTTLDTTNLVNLRRQFRAATPPDRDVPGYTDVIVKLAALVLRDHPTMNARWVDERVEILQGIHIGIAVDTDAGLLVPVIRDADRLGLGEVVARSRDLIRKARAGGLSAGEMQGGTFTITNLGSFGIETFTPIINLPECAILGLGRIERRPVMVGEQVAARERMSLSLTFDHRIVDGAPASRFLQQLVRLIENPSPWLIP